MQLPLGWVDDGSEVEIRWAEGAWYPAEVTEVFDYPDTRTIQATYPGWAKKWDEWVGDEARVRKPTGEVQMALERTQKMCGTTAGHRIVEDMLVYDVEDVVNRRWNGRKRCYEYRVIWAGDYALKDKRSWEPAAHLEHTDWVEFYEARERNRERVGKTRQAKLMAPSRPHVLEKVGDRAVDPEDAEFLEEELGRAASIKLARQKVLVALPTACAALPSQAAPHNNVPRAIHSWDMA